MESIIVGFIIAVCILGFTVVIRGLIYTLSPSISGKEHIEQYMSEKYGENWFEEMVEGLRNPEVRKGIADILGLKQECKILK
jgi:chemotaxis receptor (MCP) glutamine deamidase CheD